MTTSPLFAKQGTTSEIEHGTIFQPKFDDNGLLAAIVTDAASGEVLMLAWMNAEALSLTLATKVAHFYSRSRQRIWKKGEESGNLLNIVEVRTDCDQDAVLLRATLSGAGVACHTGARSCFYRSLATDQPSGSPQKLTPVAANVR